jgi:hypothetical protein
MPFVPKKPRQAHVPQQQRRKRKPQRPFMTAAARAAEPVPEDETSFEPNFADEPAFMGTAAAAMAGQTGPVDTRPQPRGRRLEALRGTRDQAAIRVTPGQLPTYERSFLQDELRRITIIFGGLLALILVLTVLLR